MHAYMHARMHIYRDRLAYAYRCTLAHTYLLIDVHIHKLFLPVRLFVLVCLSVYQCARSCTCACSRLIITLNKLELHQADFSDIVTDTNKRHCYNVPSSRWRHFIISSVRNQSVLSSGSPPHISATTGTTGTSAL